MPRALSSAETGVTQLSPLSDEARFERGFQRSAFDFDRFGLYRAGQKPANAYTPVVSDDTIKEEAPPTAPLYKGPFNDRVVYLGMNIDATRRARAADESQCQSHHHHRRWAARPRAQRRQTLRFAPEEWAGRLSRRVLVSTQPRERACCGRWRCARKRRATNWANSPRFGRRAKKARRSHRASCWPGHSNGDGVWGDDNGSLRLGPLLELSRALPNATAQNRGRFCDRLSCLAAARSRWISIC